MQGILIGLNLFIIIIVFHPIVIKCEYYFSKKIWPLFSLYWHLLIEGIYLSQQFYRYLVLLAFGAFKNSSNKNKESQMGGLKVIQNVIN